MRSSRPRACRHRCAQSGPSAAGPEGAGRHRASTHPCRRAQSCGGVAAGVCTVAALALSVAVMTITPSQAQEVNGACEDACCSIRPPAPAPYSGAPLLPAHAACACRRRRGGARSHTRSHAVMAGAPRVGTLRHWHRTLARPCGAVLRHSQGLKPPTHPTSTCMCDAPTPPAAGVHRLQHTGAGGQVRAARCQGRMGAHLHSEIHGPGVLLMLKQRPCPSCPSHTIGMRAGAVCVIAMVRRAQSGSELPLLAGWWADALHAPARVLSIAARLSQDHLQAP